MHIFRAKQTSKDGSFIRVRASLAILLGLGATALSTAGCVSSNATASMHNTRGVESFTSGRYDDAITYFRESLDENPENAETYYNLASAYQRKAAETGDTTLLGQAEDAYWTALELAPKPETIVCCYRGLATSAMARGDSDGALKTLEAWRDRNPESIEPKLEIAYLLEAQQKDAEAYELLKEVSVEAPNDYRAFYKMGVLSERAGDLNDAVENAKVARQLNPTDATVVQRATSFEKQFAAQQKNDGNSNMDSSSQETAVAAAQFADQFEDGDAAVHTTSVQTTAAQAQENESPQIEMTLPTDDPSGVPMSNLNTSPESTSTPDAALGFGTALASNAETSDVEKAKALSSSSNNRKVRDDSDVKWLTSANAERIRQSITQTSAAIPAKTTETGFEHTNGDGTGTPSRSPSSTISTVQFETPSFVASSSNAASSNSSATQKSSPTTSDTTQQPTSSPVFPTAASPEAFSRVPNAAELIPKTSPFSGDGTQRPSLRVGPPRTTAGSFF